MPHSRKITTLLAAATLVVAAACTAKDAPTGPRPTGPSSRLRVVNATPDPTLGGPVNVKLGDQVFAAGLNYGVSTIYQRVYTGQRELHVRRTADTAVTVADQSFSHAADLDFTTLIIDRTTANSGTGVTTLTIPDDNTPPAAGQVKLRFVHAAPSGGSVDVYVTAPAASIASVTPNVSALTYRNASGYVTLPAGTYRVRFTTAGTKTVLVDLTQTPGTAPGPLPPTPTVPAPTLPALVAGQIRTIVLYDKFGGGTPSAVSVIQDRNP